MTEKKGNAAAYLLLVLVFVLWGSLYVVSSQVLQELPPFTILFLRFLIAYLFLTVLTAVKKEKPRDIAPEHRKYLYYLAFGGYTAAVGLQLIGTKLTGSTAASLINSMNPVTISLFAALLLKEKLSWNKILGIFLTICGVYAIVGRASLDPMKCGVSVLAVLLWSLTSVMTRRGLSGYDPIHVTRKAIGYASVFCFLFAGIEICLTGMPTGISLGAALRLVYMAIGCTAIPYFLWNYSLARLPAANCSAFYPVQPLSSALLGILILGEEIQTAFWIGSVLIIGGILVTLVIKPKG